MSILKVKIAPAQREAQAYAAKQIIAAKSKFNSEQNRKSYPIAGRDGETGLGISFFGKRGFGRG